MDMSSSIFVMRASLLEQENSVLRIKYEDMQRRLSRKYEELRKTSFNRKDLLINYTFEEGLAFIISRMTYK